MELTQAHRNALQDILLWRRDVRHFQSDPIPDAILERLRKAMDFAPSVGNARPWTGGVDVALSDVGCAPL